MQDMQQPQQQPQAQAPTSGLFQKGMGIFSPRLLLMAAIVAVVVVLVLMMSAGKKPQTTGSATEALPSIEEAAVRLDDAGEAEIVLAPQETEEVPVEQEKDAGYAPPAPVDPLAQFEATLDEISIQTPAAEGEAAQGGAVEAVETVAVQETLSDTAAAVASEYPSWMMVQQAPARAEETATDLSLAAGEDVVTVHSRMKDQVDEQQALIQRMQQQDMQIEALQKQLAALQQALGEQQEWNHTLQAGLYRSGILKAMPAPATDGRTLAADSFVAAASRAATPLPAAASPRASTASSSAKRLASQIQIASVDMWNGQPSVVLMLKGSDGYQSLSPGESINGMTLKAADAARQSAVFVVNGREVTIGREPQ